MVYFELTLGVSFFLSKRLKTKAPIKAPYKLLFMGLEVIIHVPDEQPINFQ